VRWLGKDEVIDSLQTDTYFEDVWAKEVTAYTPLMYAEYTYSYGVHGGAISTINLQEITALPSNGIVDAENSFIVTQTPVGGNAGATIEIGIDNSGGGFGLFLGADTDFFMAPTAYNAAPFNGYGGVAKGLAKVGRINDPGIANVTFKIAGNTLTSGLVQVLIAYKALD